MDTFNGYKSSAIILVLFTALMVARPLLGAGFIPTHDGEYHLIRFMEFDREIKAGNIFPRWSGGLNAGYGVPLFNFFYPLPNYLAEAFHLLGFSFIDSFKLVMAFGIISAALFFYLWIEKLWGIKAALVGALFYILAPYFLLDVYIRGSIGEVLALAIYPAILWLVEKKHLFTPVFLALLILAHNILALIFLPFLISYLLFRRYSIIYALYIILVAFGLSCFFWLPALVEAKYVTGLKMINYADHFPVLTQLLMPSWGSGYSTVGINDGMSFQIGLAHILAVIVSVWLVMIQPQKSPRRFLIFFLIWFTAILCLLLEFSLPLWKIIPFLGFFQYPWRWLSLIILVSSAIAALVTRYFSGQKFICLILLPVIFYSTYCRPVIYPPRQDSYYLQSPDWTEGTATLGNSFNTIWWQAPSRMPVEPLTVIKGRADIEMVRAKSTRWLFKIKAEDFSHFQTRLAYFPGWQVYANHEQLPVEYSQGIIGFQLPEGDYQLEIVFTPTPVRFWAPLVSAISLLLLILEAIFKIRYANFSGR